MFDLLWGKIGALLLLLCFANLANAQRFGGDDNINFRDFQQKPYYFGLTLGLNSTNFKPFRSSDFVASDSILAIQSVSGPGFNLGIVTNLKIGNYFDFRFLPTLSFAERTIEFTRSSRVDALERTSLESIFVEVPFQFRYKSAPFNDMRLFLIGGVKYSFDVASNSNAKRSENLIRIAPSDFSIEYGAGIQFFFPFFIFSPEFKVSHGIGNTLIFNNQLEQSTVLEKLLSTAFTISLHFEG